MQIERCAIRQLRLVSGLALCLALLPVTAQAFTREDQSRLCMGDAFRLCSSEIPDVARITACMRRKRAYLSEGCRRVFGKPTERSASVRY